MKVLLELEVKGKFEEPLTNDGIVDVLTAVIYDGADNVGLEAHYQIVKMITDKSETK